MKTLRLFVAALAMPALFTTVYAQEAQKPVSITVSPADVSLTNVGRPTVNIGAGCHG